MLGATLVDVGRPLELLERTRLVPEHGEVVIDVRAAALNRRDYWITQGLYPGTTTPVVLGSDGSGTVSANGSADLEGMLGRDVVINPGWGWGPDQRAQSSAFRILGMPDDGCLANQVVAPAVYVHPKPAHLDWREAAALPLAGLTAYRALLVQGRLAARDRVLINGVGGGVAAFAMQFAIAAGNEVIVTSSSSSKIAQAIELGAAAGFAYTEDNWSKEIAAAFDSIDLIIDGAGGDGYAKLVELAAPGGRIVSYGDRRTSTEARPVQGVLETVAAGWFDHGIARGLPGDARLCRIASNSSRARSAFSIGGSQRGARSNETL